MARATAKTELFSTWMSGSVVVADQGLSTGNRFWVDSNIGVDDTGHGRQPEAPFATLAYAYSSNVFTANNGDIVYIMEGHSETIVGAAGIAMDINGVSVIGLGYGDSRPVFTFTTAAAASILITGCDTLIKNCRFVCNIANQNHMLDLVADDLTVEDCWFLEGSATGLTFITADTADADSNHCHLKHNLMYAPTAGNYDSAICINKDQHDWYIEDNDIYGDWDDACISVPAGGNTSTMLRIYNNRLTNLQTGDHCIEINGVAVTGWIVGNRCQTDTQAATIDAGICSCHGNTWSNVSGDFEAIPVNPQIAGTTSVVSALGTDGTTVTDSATTVLGAVGANSANNVFASNLVAGNIDGSALERLEYLQQSVEHCVVKADGTVTNPTDALFTVAGGPVLVVEFYGLVTTDIGLGLSTCQIQFIPTLPAATTVNFSTAVDIDSDAAGTTYSMTVATPGIFTPTTAGAFDQVPAQRWLWPVGACQAAFSATRAGVIAWYCVYKPLSPTSIVTATA